MRLPFVLPLIALAAAQPAAAEEYTLMIYETADRIALRADPGSAGAAYWAGYAKIGGELAKAGILKGGTALDASAPQPGDKLGGYFVIDVADRAAAERWAAKIPAARVAVIAHVPTPTGM